MRTAEDLAHGRDNNFNLIRMVAASAVIVSHSFPLSTGSGTWEPLLGWPFTLGSAAVQVFFVVSGFFILKSFDRQPSLSSFALARAARLLPGLLVVTTITALLVRGGVSFAQNPFPDLVNGSLWTLKYEAICYVGLALVGVLGFYRNERFPAFLGAFAALYVAINTGMLVLSPAELLSRAYAFLSLPFVLGMAAYQYRRFLPLNGYIAAGLTVVALTLPTEQTWTVWLGYSALWLGSIRSPLTAYNRLGDYSYGTYIYGWPVQQLTVLLLPGITPFALMAIALPVAWMLGFLSWRFVEEPALQAVKGRKATASDQSAWLRRSSKANCSRSTAALPAEGARDLALSTDAPCQTDQP